MPSIHPSLADVTVDTLVLLAPPLPRPDGPEAVITTAITAAAAIASTIGARQRHTTPGRLGTIKSRRGRFSRSLVDPPANGDAGGGRVQPSRVVGVANPNRGVSAGENTPRMTARAATAPDRRLSHGLRCQRHASGRRSPRRPPGCDASVSAHRARRRRAGSEPAHQSVQPASISSGNAVIQ